MTRGRGATLMGIGQKDFLEEVRAKLAVQGLPDQESQEILWPSSLDSKPVCSPVVLPLDFKLWR